jgi:hypothetical protein
MNYQILTFILSHLLVAVIFYTFTRFSTEKKYLKLIGEINASWINNWNSLITKLTENQYPKDLDPNDKDFN